MESWKKKGGQAVASEYDQNKLRNLVICVCF